MTNIIVKNAVECKKCGEVVESRHRHDFLYCHCGAISVDGGTDYLRRGGDVHGGIDRSMIMPQKSLDACIEAMDFQSKFGGTAKAQVLAVILTLEEHGMLNLDKFKGGIEHD
tara:strand:+ start:3994 stop:4329 length:336 start_codon:yes stop_codon:yes gene_type:complete